MSDFCVPTVMLIWIVSISLTQHFIQQQAMFGQQYPLLVPPILSPLQSQVPLAAAESGWSARPKVAVGNATPAAGNDSGEHTTAAHRDFSLPSVSKQDQWPDVSSMQQESIWDALRSKPSTSAGGNGGPSGSKPSTSAGGNGGPSGSKPSISAGGNGGPSGSKPSTSAGGNGGPSGSKPSISAGGNGGPSGKLPGEKEQHQKPLSVTKLEEKMVREEDRKAQELKRKEEERWEEWWTLGGGWRLGGWVEGHWGVGGHWEGGWRLGGWVEGHREGGWRLGGWRETPHITIILLMQIN